MRTATEVQPDPDPVVAWACRMAREWSAKEGAAEEGSAKPAGPVTVLRGSPTVLVTVADVVVKVHQPGTDPDQLAARLRLAADPALAGCLLAPLDPNPLPVDPRAADPADPLRDNQIQDCAPRADRWRDGPCRDRRLWASVWPRIEPVAPTPEAVPWSDAGRLLARLHTTPLAALDPDPGTAGMPPHGAVQRLHRDLGELDATLTGLGHPPGEQVRAAVDVVHRAAAALPDGARSPESTGRPTALVHGDWHLGQLGRHQRIGSWLLIDIDDLGIGNPVWDLARPAAFWACGLLPDDDWHALLDGYRSGGATLAADPWPELDPVAQACVVQTAAAGIRRVLDPASGQHLLDDVDHRLIEACARMIGRR